MIMRYTLLQQQEARMNKLKKVPLVELDREAEVNNLTTIYIPPVKNETLIYKDFYKLKGIIAELRGPMVARGIKTNP